MLKPTFNLYLKYFIFHEKRGLNSGFFLPFGVGEDLAPPASSGGSSSSTRFSGLHPPHNPMHIYFQKWQISVFFIL